VTASYIQAGHGFAVNDYVYLDGSTWTRAAEQRIATHKVTAVALDGNSFTGAVLEASVKPPDFFAVCNLAAGLCCEAIAGKYSRTSDTTINADSVNHVSKAGEFARRAKELIALYEKHVGGDAATGNRPAAAFVDMDTAPGWPAGRQYLFHGRGTR